MDFSKFGKYKTTRVINRTKGYCSVLASGDGESVFIKAPLNEQGEKMIRREYENQKFLFELSKKEIGFDFLNPKMDNQVLIYPDMTNEVEWLGADKTRGKSSKSKIAPLSLYLESFIEFEKELHEIAFDQLPGFVREDWKVRRGRILEHFQENIGYVEKNRLIDPNILSSWRGLFSEYYDNWSYQHHDVVPWHIGRKKNGRFLLIDSNWACWSLRYYDLAYYALQMVGYADKVEDASALLAEAEKVFGEDDNFNDILMAGMIYRSVKLTKELIEERGTEKYAQEVCGFAIDHYSMITKK